MFTPDMLNMPTAMAESRDTEDYILNSGLETDGLVFMVVVPELGACRVPAEALSHFMAGDDEYTADKMPEHWSGQLSGKWPIKRSQLRILADSWAKRMALRDRIHAYLERQQDETAPATDTATPAPVTDWKNTVRAEAWEQWVKTLAENGTPTLESVSVHLANWCDAKQIKTDTGKFPKSGYIKIHVIDGKHWEPPRNMSRDAAKKHLEQKKQEKQAN